jgi:roadblock/LC7 domain-containing protein
MSILLELSGQPGFIAAGEYSYRGDRFSFKGNLTDDMARMASIMCRATTMSEHMQAGIIEKFCPACGLMPPKGWIVRGPAFTVCNMANVFVFLDNNNSKLNDIMGVMKRYLNNESQELI